jgi:hypothetical protein
VLSALARRLARRSGRRPRLSVVVVVHRMPDQAERTLRSLSVPYQQGVRASDYEILVVENRSDRPFGPERAARAAPGARHVHRDETRRSPVGAVNFGVAEARAPHVAVVIDGARMATPGVVRLTLAALRADPDAVVAVPGYHLGHEPQQDAVNTGHDEAADAALLASIGWPADGYRLFEVGSFSGSSRRGFLRPQSEANFLAVSKARWRAAGGMDPRYDDLGGGKANFDLYNRLLAPPGTALFLLFGEGTFHQVHGGITTNTPAEEREPIMEAIRAQDRLIRGDAKRPAVRAHLFGVPHPAMHRFLQQSLSRAG